MHLAAATGNRLSQVQSPHEELTLPDIGKYHGENPLDSQLLDLAQV